MIDVVKIKIKAGNGGDGKVSFRHDKLTPRGGPDGGDGGKGGDVYLVADRNMATLRDFRAKEMFSAQDGQPGGKKKMFGPDGSDNRISVPLGTLVYEIKDGREILVADLNEDGKTFLIAVGGRGGKGNFRFRSSTNQVPIQYTPGGIGEQKTVKLEIKLVADVGFIGLPNAGKSTLLNHLTHSNVKVANYPFTTLSPNLGVMELKDGEPLIFSDIPGLIEGASQGKGLGDEFLRHVERTRILVHLIDPFDGYVEGSGISMADVCMRNYRKIRKELEIYGKGLVEKPEIVAINKLDLTEVRENFEQIETVFKKQKKNVFAISAVSGEGVDELIQVVKKLLAKHPKRKEFNVEEPVKIFNISNLPNKRMVFGRNSVVSMVDKKI